MGSQAQFCLLKCLLDSHAPIKLIHNVETIIGRSKLTKIKDPACSRQQLLLKANCEEYVVDVKQLGVNASGIDGFALKRDGQYKVEHGSRIEILLNNFIHVLEFCPPPGNCDNLSSGSKRKLEERESPRKKKSKEMEADPIKSAVVDSWTDIDKGELYVFTSKDVKSSCKIAAFDMDGTLIKTKSGKVHPVDINDWQIAFPNAKKKLKELIEEGFKLVILSNQAPIGNGRVKIEDFKIKIENIVKALDVPFQVYLATGKGFYRKPTTGMWKVLSEQNNDGFVIDMAESFYCGDAAGRIANWAPGKKKDHSLADKLMAENLGLKFYTPEEFFMQLPRTNIQMKNPAFNPKELRTGTFDSSLIQNEKEILVLVGYPGSGKSFLAKKIEKKSEYKYVTVCRDILGSWQKCAAEATKALQRGKSVIVDSTNPDIESRGRWVSLAKEMDVDCRCASLRVSMDHARHNNKFRELMKIKHVPVNDIVFHTYNKKYVEPSTKEGFKEVIPVNFYPNFEDKTYEEVYRMHLLEK